MEISIQRLRFLEWMIAFDVTSLFVWFWFSLCFLKLLWSFISAQLGEDETNSFRLTHAIPGASKILDYESNSTFQESGLANSMISVTWDWVRVHYWVKFADWELQICDSHLYDPVFHLFMRLFNFKEKVIETFFVYRLYESEWWVKRS